MHPQLISGLLWGTLFLGFAAALLRRSVVLTSPSLVRSYFSRDADLDESEKLHRIDVLLGASSLVFRGLWAGTLMLARERGAWYAGPPVEGASLEAWRVLAFLAEVLVIGMLAFELLPQVAATWIGEKIGVALLPTLDRVERGFSPMTRAYRSVRRALLRAVGNGERDSEADLATRGIRVAVEIGEREGILQPGEKSMIESMLEFHDAEVLEVMTPRTEMVCLEASTTIEDAIPQVVACGHSRVPVYRKEIDEVIGVLYAKDLLRYAGDAQQRSLSVEQAVRKIHFVPESKKIGELLAEFRSERFHIAVVLDEYGGTSGLITIEDILEEIVGEIEDEYDSATLAAIRRISSDVFDLDGRANLWDVNKETDLGIPESDDYETVAGYIFSTLGRVPKEGDSFEEGHLRFEITSADERKIKRVRVRVLHPQGQDAAGPGKD